MPSTQVYDVKSFDVKLYNKILSNGLSKGIGKRGRRVCIEAAICQVLGMPHGDDPHCVDEDVRAAKIKLNDAPWSTAKARAEGLYNLGLAQLGSNIFKPKVFTKACCKKVKSKIFPVLLQDAMKVYSEADLPELYVYAKHSSSSKADKLVTRLDGISRNQPDLGHWELRDAILGFTVYTNWIGGIMDTTWYCYGWNRSLPAKKRFPNDKYFILCADIMLEVLKDLKSPGVELLPEGKNGRP